jgi:Uma2 family endonuclease
MHSFVLDLKPIIDLSDEQFFQLCQRHDVYKFERNANGEIIIMTPAGGETGNRNADITYQLQSWTRQDGSGLAFDSSTGFRLPNRAVRSPDAAWVQKFRWQSLTAEEREKFPPLCPDFVIELLSPSDSLGDLQAKMQDYIDNGTRLAWLIDRFNRKVEVYRQGSKEILDSPATVSGEDVLPEFVLEMSTVW